MRVDPVSTVLQDAGLRRKLAEGRAGAAFERWIEDVVPPAHPEAAGMRDEILARAVEAFMASADEDAAFLRYRAMGMYAKGGALDAFEDLYRMVDADLAGVIGQRSLAIGYPGPLDGPRLVRAGHPALEPATYLVVPLPEMLGEAACAGVEIDEGAPFREPDGRLVWTRMRWHWIRGEASGEIPPGLVDELVDAARRPSPAASPDASLISDILADLLDDDRDGMAEFAALCEPSEAEVLLTRARGSLERLASRVAAHDRAGSEAEVAALGDAVGLIAEYVAAMGAGARPDKGDDR